jgi:hypothetical protein
MRAGSVTTNCSAVAGVARIMAHCGGNTREEEGSVYQPILQSELGGSQANEAVASYVSTNVNTIAIMGVVDSVVVKEEVTVEVGFPDAGTGTVVVKEEVMVVVEVGLPDVDTVGFEIRPPPPYITGRKVVFPADAVLWPDHTRPLERIKKDNHFDALNHCPVSKAFEMEKALPLWENKGRILTKASMKLILSSMYALCSQT